MFCYMIDRRQIVQAGLFRSCIYLFLLVAVCAGTRSGEWQTLDQPTLKQELENAPTLKLESLGEPARGVNVWERWVVPNHGGKSWDLLQIYFKEYYGPT